MSALRASNRRRCLRCRRNGHDLRMATEPDRAEQLPLHERTPYEPDPQEQAGSTDAGTESEPALDDDSPVERYRDSPGKGVIMDEEQPPEPNEPG